MADNTTLNAGSGGDIIATDDLAGVKHQLVKVEFGGDGVATMVSTSNPLPVQIADGADLALVSAGGAILVDASGAAVPVVGATSHSSAASTTPVLLAGISQNMDDTAPPNQVDAEGDAVRLSCDRDGALFVRMSGPRVWSYHENSSTQLTDAVVHAAPGAGLSLYVTDVIISTGAATALNVFFEEGASTVLGPMYLEATAGRGAAIQFFTPKKISVNTALTVTTSAAIAHSIEVTGFIAAG